MKTIFEIQKEFTNLLSSKLIIESIDDPSKEGSVSNNTRGVMHEILVGKHLNGGEHMRVHINKHGETPTQTHDRLKKQIHPNDYKKINSAAKSAADHIRSHLAKTHPGHTIQAVTHTSKKGDTQLVTGIKASQKQDSSDVYLTTKHPKTGKLIHHGISLKVSGTSTSKLPVSSLGSQSSGSKATGLHDAHKNAILKAHPKFAAVSKNKEARKALIKSEPAMAADIKSRHRGFLTNVAKHHAEELKHHLSSGNHSHVVSHIRDVLHAHKTPAQEQGHNFFKHTTYETSKGTQHHIDNPSIDHEHILKDPKNISVVSKGTSVHFLHKGKKFAIQSHKIGSQSDPLSSLKSVGKVA
jgi:hypothetical protein